jgi:transposase
MDNNIFAAALGINEPWFIENLSFDADKQLLSVHIDFNKGSRFSCPEMAGDHPLYDSRIKRYRHLNFFQHECYLEVRVPRVKLPDGHIVLIDPPWAGKLSGFTLLFEALILALCQQMTFAGVAQLVGLSWHRVHAICTHYVDLALAQADLSELKSIAIDETSRHRGQDYITVVADADERKVIFVDEGHGSGTIANFATELLLHGSGPDRIESACIDMSPAYIRRHQLFAECEDHLR